MSRPILMPRLGESVTEGTVTCWLKKVGDRVEVGETLLEVSTDKTNVEIDAPYAGILLEIKVGPDETVEVGSALGIIGEAGQAGQPGPEALAEPVANKASVPNEKPPVSSNEAKGDVGARQQATPLARRLARQHGVDLASVIDIGPGGRIRKRNILKLIEGSGASTAPDQLLLSGSIPASSVNPRERVEPMSRIRQVIATRMFESLQTSAQLTTVVEVDITRIARIREQAKHDFAAREGVKLSFLPFIALATIEALKTHPIVNAFIDMSARTIKYHEDQHLGIAVDTERGLLVPVIHDAGVLNLSGLVHSIAEIAERARTLTNHPDELSGGTFTITNTGSRGALFDTPIINQPQSAILGVGAVVKRVAVVTQPDVGETIAIRSIVYLALSYDHRIIDGADAARFLTTVKKRLEDGKFEGELGLN